MIEINWDPDRRFLRQFTALFILFFGIVGALCYFRHELPGVALTIWVVAGLIGTFGFFILPMMRWIYVGWMVALFPVGWVMSHLILAVVLYLVMTPVGIIMRLCGRDPAHRKFDPTTESYWIARRSEEGTKRYFKQF